MAANKPARSLASIAGIVALATLISKVFGLFREQAIAAAFGVGPAINAYAYAYVIPGFLLILLGGINGPFHSALVSALSKRDKSEAAAIVETVTTLVTGALILVSVLMVFAAPVCIDVLGPGLDAATRVIAIRQLQIMAPMAILAGLIGIGFGTLNAADQYWLPSISPLFSSLAVVSGVGLLVWQLGSQINAPEYLQLGGMVLAGTTMLGALLQWFAQLFAQWRSGLGKLRLRFDWRNPGVKETIAVMIPATLSSGMLHINVYTDLFFASGIESAAAALRYANFIVLTPLGIVSNMILVPMLPVFSRLAAPENWPELKQRIRQGLVLSGLSMLPLSALFIALALPIIRVIYEHFNFDAAATRIVAPVLMAYGIGMFFYLGRDVLVRVFYALGDGQTPFRISIINIFINAILDFILVGAFKTPGLVFATIGVNVISMIIFLLILNKRLKGLPLGEWSRILLGLTGCSALGGLAGWGVHQSFWHWVSVENFFLQILDLTISSGVAITIFGVLAMVLKLPELTMFMQRMQQKILRKNR